MAVRTQSILDRINGITLDPTYKRFRLPQIALYLNEGASLIAESAARASSVRRAFTLAAGSQQDLRTDNNVQWIRLRDIPFNIVNGQPGATIRKVERKTLDNVSPTWRRRTQSGVIQEYSLDETLPFTFDVYPPAIAGTQVQVEASVRPAPFCILNPGGTALLNPVEEMPLADGFDIPLVDFALYRLFSRDAGEASYQARASGHLQAAQMATGIVVKDAAA